MKIRQGFVSNSSSSSFCTYEVVIPRMMRLTKAEIKEALVRRDFENGDIDCDSGECPLIIKGLDPDPDDCVKCHYILYISEFEKVKEALRALRKNKRYKGALGYYNEFAGVLAIVLENRGLVVNSTCVEEEGRGGGVDTHSITVLTAKEIDSRIGRLKKMKELTHCKE